MFEIITTDRNGVAWIVRDFGNGGNSITRYFTDEELAEMAKEEKRKELYKEIGFKAVHGEDYSLELEQLTGL